MAFDPCYVTAPPSRMRVIPCYFLLCNTCFDLLMHTTYFSDPRGCESLSGSPCTGLHGPAERLRSHRWSP